MSVPRALTATILGACLLAGCGSSGAGGNGVATSSRSGSSTSTSSAATSSTPSPSSASSRTGTGTGTGTGRAPSTAPSSGLPGDVTLRGTVSGDGLTCVGFVATNGRRYALTGPGLPDRLVAIAHSFGQQASSSSAAGAGQTATVTIVGHPVPGAMSTCSATVFSVTSARIGSMTTR